MASIFNLLIYSFLWLFTLLPLKVLYGISNFMYFLAYHVIGYRKKVVYTNLSNAFPGKNEKEIKSIARKFYKHLCDFLVESVKTIHMNEKGFRKRCTFVNVELLNNLYDEGKDITLISGHYGNWEWMTSIPLFIKHTLLVIYKPLRNEMIDEVIRNLRGKFGIIPVPKKDIYKEVLAYKSRDTRTITWFLGDQRPPGTNHYWSKFLNQDTAFFTGAEKIAKKLNHAVVFIHVRKVKRGYYETHFIPLFHEASKTRDNEITEKQLRVLEEKIVEEPAYWLWSHKRWKTRKPDHIQ